jgi:2-iminobutanoate/2-iminopropanoate deaminase
MKKAYDRRWRYPYSTPVRAGDFVFVSGQAPIGEDGKVNSGELGAQVRCALDNLGKAVAVAGCGFSDVVKVNVFFDDARDFGCFKEIYATYFTDLLPAEVHGLRSTGR